MSNSLVNRVSFLFSLVTFLVVMVFSTLAQAQYSSSGKIVRSHGSGGQAYQNRSFNNYQSARGGDNRGAGLRLNTHGLSAAQRSGVRLGNSRYYKRDFVTRTLQRNNRAVPRNTRNNRNFDNRRIRHVQNTRIQKNEGYSYNTNPRNNRNARRTNQFNSDSDLYYVDQFGYRVLSSNNGDRNRYYDDDFNQIVVIQGEGETPTCPKGLNCGYRLYEDGTGPRIITLGGTVKGLPPQDGLTGGPKVIRLGN